MEDAKGNLWIATQGKGLFKYIPQNKYGKGTTRHKVSPVTSSTTFALTGKSAVGSDV